jgi:hypothetical protein
MSTPERPAPRVSGDERFVPASHVLVSDRRVSHAAFRLWCVLHRLWFLHEPPAMALLQELMGSFHEKKQVWQPATRRSIERWLGELEVAGWLVWSRREEASRRYHLRTSAQSAGDAAVIRALRALLNAGGATLAEVQALLSTPVDAMPESQHPPTGSHPDASAPEYTTAESQGAIPGSPDTTGGSQDATAGSYDATAESQHAISPSQGGAGDAILTPQESGLRHEIPQIPDLREEIPPPPPGVARGGDGGGGGPTATERYLLREGFSARAAREFQALTLTAALADIARRRELGQGIGAIVTAWRIEPPTEPVASEAPDASRATNAKEAALAIAPSDAGALEIQYLALDLEDGLLPAAALANLAARRGQTLLGGGI